MSDGGLADALRWLSRVKATIGEDSAECPHSTDADMMEIEMGGDDDERIRCDIKRLIDEERGILFEACGPCRRRDAIPKVLDSSVFSHEIELSLREKLKGTWAVSRRVAADTRKELYDVPLPCLVIRKGGL